MLLLLLLLLLLSSLLLFLWKTNVIRWILNFSVWSACILICISQSRRTENKICVLAVTSGDMFPLPPAAVWPSVTSKCVKIQPVNNNPSCLLQPPHKNYIHAHFPPSCPVICLHHPSVALHGDPSCCHVQQSSFTAPLASLHRGINGLGPVLFQLLQSPIRAHFPSTYRPCEI